MPLPQNLFAPSFRRQRLSILFSAVVGFMVFAATLAVIATTTISAFSLNWNNGVEARMTVEIPPVDDESSVPQADRIRQTLSILHAMPAVANAHLVSDEATLSLLKPWITDSNLLKTLPVPSLIDIDRKPGMVLNSDDVLAGVKTVVSEAQVDDHIVWLADLLYLIRGLVTLSTIMGLIAAFTLIVTVSLFCRAVMAGQNDTVALLHTMGAADEDIARHFQSLAIRLAWAPSLIGFICAVISVSILLYFLQRFADMTALAPLHWMVLAGLSVFVPCAAIGITAFSARISIGKLLQALP